ncbi:MULTISPECIES: LacI family DNA-binding transcriptional regulator [Caloramator]|uniref:Transcriptional regulator, LacI family n=1 Tax=Caloramator proteoclasticus DSM 10124 TaxID=1121262 RepID=A0A1M4XUX5_9CLOT|nr:MULTISPECIES: LacI family DNA-binding transcriptional regulator [Caloramator]SHE97289.1 transcriptional regulator, LacI family [Caloramator proteoclasticus DSM 10124]
MLNIRDIAKLAGVSPATVSRVINNSANVNEEKRQRVLEVLEQTGYKPNALARGLLYNKTFTLGVVVPDISNINFSEFVKGIEKEARQNSYNIILMTSGNEPEREVECFEILKEKRVDGIIFAGTILTDRHKQHLDNSNIPFVVFGQDFEYKSLISINLDNLKASYDAVRYLYSKGIKKVAMITGPLWDKSAGYDRYIGFLKASIENGINQRDLIYKDGDFTITSGYENMKKILEQDRVEAVFAANDFMALGAIKYLLDNNIKVPQDIKVVGFDDNPIAKIYTPSLSTIKIDFYNAGVLAVKAAIKCLDGIGDEKRIPIEYEIIERQSSI